MLCAEREGKGSCLVLVSSSSCLLYWCLLLNKDVSQLFCCIDIDNAGQLWWTYSECGNTETSWCHFLDRCPMQWLSNWFVLSSFNLFFNSSQTLSGLIMLINVACSDHSILFHTNLSIFVVFSPVSAAYNDFILPSIARMSDKLHDLLNCIDNVFYDSQGFDWMDYTNNPEMMHVVK